MIYSCNFPRAHEVRVVRLLHRTAVGLQEISCDQVTGNWISYEVWQRWHCWAHRCNLANKPDQHFSIAEESISNSECVWRPVPLRKTNVESWRVFWCLLAPHSYLLRVEMAQKMSSSSYILYIFIRKSFIHAQIKKKNPSMSCLSHVLHNSIFWPHIGGLLHLCRIRHVSASLTVVQAAQCFGKLPGCWSRSSGNGSQLELKLSSRRVTLKLNASRSISLSVFKRT